MLKRLVQFMLILLAAALGYQLPHHNIDLLWGLLGVISYALLSFGVLHAVDRLDRS